MTRLTFLQINDIHGYVAPHRELVRNHGGEWEFTELGGLARIAGFFDAVRAENPDSVIALDNGDTFHGTHLAVSSEGRKLVPMLNELGLDAMTVHWEFAYGPDGVRELAALLDYPVLAINCYNEACEELVFPPYTVVNRAGLRIAIIGIACPIVDKTMPPAFSAGVRFTIGNKELPGWIAHVRAHEHADLVVVLSHLGFPQDVKLAGEVDGIDLLVSGHTHNRMSSPVVVNGAIVFQSGCHGSFVGRLDVEIAGGRITSHEHLLVAVDAGLTENAAMASLVKEALSAEPVELAQVIGQVGAPLHRYAMLSAPMDDLLLEAIADAAGTQIAFSNGWRYGAPIPPGPVTLDDLWNIIPTNPPVSVVEMTGSEIRQMLEENLERTFAADPYEQMGGFVKRMRGIVMYFRAENPAHHRIDRLFANGDPIDHDKYYTAAFVTAQGVPGKFGRNRRTIGTDAITAMRMLFERSETVIPSCVESVREI